MKKLVALYCISCLAFSLYVLSASMWCIHIVVWIQPLLMRDSVLIHWIDQTSIYNRLPIDCSPRLHKACKGDFFTQNIWHQKQHGGWTKSWVNETLHLILGGPGSNSTVWKLQLLIYKCGVCWWDNRAAIQRLSLNYIYSFIFIHLFNCFCFYVF